MYALFIANKNYSSWSLRPWLLMRELRIPFEERMMTFADGSNHDAFRAFSPTGKVPCLVEAGVVVWESLGITEYLGERHRGVWPADAAARTWARCAAAEMHAGFEALRAVCTMNCGIRVRLHAMTEALAGDLARLAELWNEGLGRFGGPYLAGQDFCAVDAFFAPVAIRMQTYGLSLDAECDAYAARLRELPAMRNWYADALAETGREAGHEAEARRAGVWVEDFRAAVE